MDMIDLEKIRVINGYSKKDFCVLLGLSDKTYNNYISNPSFVGSNKYYELIDIYQKSLEPINISSDDFLSLRKEHCYYIDKTLLIKDIITNKENVILFNRPRRFGKSLNLSMINYYFDITQDKTLIDEIFSNLEISKCHDLNDKYQNKYPTIFLSFKDINASDFATFTFLLRNAFKNALEKYSDILTNLSSYEKDTLTSILTGDNNVDINVILSEAINILYKYYHQPVIVIIDEYDVPLEKASFQDYYEQALMVVKNIFSSAFKSNSKLKLGILSGCLRISKESIFTGLNNVRIKTVLDDEYSSYFGFKNEEVEKTLNKYLLVDKLDETKEYYDGYLFGNTKIYCPYDLLNYVKDHIYDHNCPASYYWINSSGNDILRKLLNTGTSETREEIKLLLNDLSINKIINFNLSYRDLYDNVDNIYSVMLASGYLTLDKQIDNVTYALKIPNKQIKFIFETQISEWIKDVVIPKFTDESLIDDAFNGNIEMLQNKINNVLRFNMGLHDLARRKVHVESFYHGLLLGMFVEANKNDKYEIKSNAEAGVGYADILINDYINRRGVIIECKNGDDVAVDMAQEKEQIEKNRYADYFLPHYHIKKYVISFAKKYCWVEEE